MEADGVKNIKFLHKITGFVILVLVMWASIYLIRSSAAEQVPPLEWAIANEIDEHKDVDASPIVTMAFGLSAVFILICYISHTEPWVFLPDQLFTIDRTPKFRHQMARSRIPKRKRTNVR